MAAPIDGLWRFLGNLSFPDVLLIVAAVFLVAATIVGISSMFERGPE